MTTVRFILNTTSSFFLDWLEEETNRLFYLSCSWTVQTERAESSRLSDKGELHLVKGNTKRRFRDGNHRDRFFLQGCTTYPYKDNPETEWMSPFFSVIEFQVTPLAPDRCEVSATCLSELLEKPFFELLQGIGERWPESGLLPQDKGRKMGLHGGTLDRVKEARKLIEKNVPKTKACKRVGIDPRTYDRYVGDVIDWDVKE